jgi:hypothetical protein
MLKVEDVQVFEHLQIFNLLDVQPLEVDGLEPDEHVDPNLFPLYFSSSDTFSVSFSSREVSAISCMLMRCSLS